jgi:hypothetical protein
MIFITQTAIDRHDSKRTTDPENTSPDRASLNALASSSSDYLTDGNTQKSTARTDPDNHFRVKSWLETQSHRNSKGKPQSWLATPKASFTTIGKPRIFVTPKEDTEKRLSSSADTTQQTQPTTNSSQEELSDESSPATSFTPARDITRGAGSASSIAEVRSPSPSTYSSFSRSASNHLPSELVMSKIKELQGRRINPKVARRRNAGHTFHHQTLRHTPSPLSGQSSVALGKRPVGCHGIGERGFTRVVDELPAVKPRPSTTDHVLSVPSRASSKRQAESLVNKVNIGSVTWAPSSVELGIHQSPPSLAALEAESVSTVVPRLVNEAVLQQTTPDLKAGDVSASSGSAKAVVTSQSSDCVPAIPQASIRNKWKRASLPTAFYATTPSVLGFNGDAIQYVARREKSDPVDHVVPLSDACPLLVGSMAWRHKLCSDLYIDERDPRVPNILKQHHIAIDMVSRSDQMLLWHLAVHDDSRVLSNTAAYSPFSYVIYWKEPNNQYSNKHVTLDHLLRWLKSKEQAHEHSRKLRKRDFERLATCSTHSRERLISRRGQYDQESAGLNATELLPNNPAAVWQHIYRLLRARGISEESLDREQYAHIMTLPRHARRAYVDTLAPKCRARSIDNACLVRHRRKACLIEEHPVLHTTTGRPSTSEEEDTIAALPALAKFKRTTTRQRSTRSSGGSSTSDWDTHLTKPSRVRLPKPLLSDIELPRNYVPPLRVKQEDDEPNRLVVVGKDGMETVRRGSAMSRFSQSTEESEREGRTRWGRFKKGVRKWFPPCCCR